MSKYTSFVVPSRLVNKPFVLLLLTLFSTSLISQTSIGNFYVDSQLENSAAIIEAINNDQEDGKAFELFSHGRSGELLIKGQWLNAKELATWLRNNQSFNKTTIQSLNIYGCEFAKGSKGLEAVNYLEKEFGISIAASNNVTGANGDWDLEIGSNNFAVVVNNYKYNLQCAGTVGGMDHDDDFDGDGVCNELDLDDDNDGILDTDEINFVQIGVNAQHVIPGGTINTSYPNGSGDVSTRLELPAGTVTVTYTDVVISGTATHFGCANGSTPDFAITSTYPLKYRPRLGRTEFGPNPQVPPNAFTDPERGFTSNDGMTYVMTNPGILNAGFSAGSSGSNFILKEMTQPQPQTTQMLPETTIFWNSSQIILQQVLTLLFITKVLTLIINFNF